MRKLSKHRKKHVEKDIKDSGAMMEWKYSYMAVA
jgi:hypothetical protein